MMNLFRDGTAAFLKWVQLWSIDIWEEQGHMHKIAKPLYYASLAGLTEASHTLLEMGADVNAQGGYFGNALQAASHKGHGEIAKLLIYKGANVNAQGGYYWNALQAASYKGHGEIATLLIQNGALPLATDHIFLL